MKKTAETAKKKLSGLVSAMIDGDSREWPPTCAVIIHQPLRPYAQKSEKITNRENILKEK